MTEAGTSLHELYRSYAPLVRRVLSRLVPHTELDDAVQEVFLRIYRFQSSFREEAQLKSWIYRITVNCAHDLYRRQRWRSWLHLGHDTQLLSAENPTVNECSEALLKALDTLSFAERSVITLFYWEDASLEEISQHLSIPVGTVKSRLSNARKKLKVLLSEESL